MPESGLEDNLDVILESISLIEERFSRIETAEDFVCNSEGVLLLDAISMRLQVIGETVKKIDKGKPAQLHGYGDIDWPKIMRLRDLISHHYEMVDYEIVFDICQNHLPQLKEAIRKMISE